MLKYRRARKRLGGSISGSVVQYCDSFFLKESSNTVQRLGRVGDESAESYPSRPAPRRVTSRSTQLRGDRLGRGSELSQSTRHYDDDFVSHHNSM